MRLKRFWACTLMFSMITGLSACGGSGNGNLGDGSSFYSDNMNETSSSNDEGEESSLLDNLIGTATDAEIAFNTESSLKGTGPATLENPLGDNADKDGKKDSASGGDATQQLGNGSTVVDINFDDNDVDGFSAYTNGGTYDLKAADGQLVADIKKVGDKDYSNQAYWDGFALSQNCVYTYSFDISCDIERKVEYRLQINGGDYHAYQGEQIEVGPEVTNFSVDFEMTEESDPAPRLVFNMGRMEGLDKDTEEHNIYIDNIKLEIKDGSKAEVVSGLPTYVNVAVNQLGYKANEPKVAVVKSEDFGEEEFIVCDAATNETVYAGKLEATAFDYGARKNTRKADFSEFNIPGEYYVYTNEGPSFTFKIEDDIYSDIYKDTVKMLYKQRCGTETDATMADGFSHKACHTDEAVVYDNQSMKKDVSGGWHDAGDYGRYVVAGAVAVADLLEAYDDFDVTSDDMGIPESGNGIPDILDEAKYELEWMMKMQDEQTGGVYHKVTCFVFPETVNPEEEKDQLYLAPISQAATGDFAAIMAKASVVYKDFDPMFSTEARMFAEKAWVYLASDETDKGFKNPEEFETGEYPDTYITDERYWAAAELYLAGKADMESYVQKYISDEKLKHGLGWADVGTYADYDLAKYAQEEIKDIAIEKLSDQAEEITEKVDKSGYSISLGSDFPWGSNMAVGNSGQLLYMAANVTGDENYANIAKQQLDYLLGTNPLGYCYVTGYGTFSPQNPHHRPSQVKGSAMTGMLVGGPNKNLDDPYAAAVLSAEGPAMCYVDNVQSYSTNEISIYWNSPLIYLLAAEQTAPEEPDVLELTTEE